MGSFLGDMWINKSESLNTIEMEVDVEDMDSKTNGNLYSMFHHYDIVKSDGILIYLPIASGAYNRALGGPLSDWGMDLMGIRYMAPSRTLAGHTGYQCRMGRRVTIRFAGWEKETALLRMDWMKKGFKIKFGHTDRDVQVYQPYSACRS